MFCIYIFNCINNCYVICILSGHAGQKRLTSGSDSNGEGGEDDGRGRRREGSAGKRRKNEHQVSWENALTVILHCMSLYAFVCVCYMAPSSHYLHVGLFAYVISWSFWLNKFIQWLPLCINGKGIRVWRLRPTIHFLYIVFGGLGRDGTYYPNSKYSIILISLCLLYIFQGLIEHNRCLSIWLSLNLETKATPI